MKSLDNLFVYQSALRTFVPGSVTFDDRVRHVSPSAEKPARRWLVPGFLDIHMHIESSMTTPGEFSRLSLCHGTTTVVADCHEVANVFGVDGLLRFMDLPVSNDTFYAIPSSVPATSSLLETTGGSIDAAEVTRLARDSRIIALGEVMNACDLLTDGDNRTRRIIRAFKDARPECPVEGHCPKLLDEKLDTFIAGGVDSDHCVQTPETIRQRAAKGMFIQIQYKSLSGENMEALKPYPGFFSFVTDDVMPDTLVSEGHLDRVVRKAIELGMPAGDAIFAATLAPANRMRLFDRGMIAPGKLADFIVLDDLQTLSIAQVYKRGELVYDRDSGTMPRIEMPGVDSSITASIRREAVKPEDFVLRIPDGVHDIVHIDHASRGTFTKKSVRREVIRGGRYDAPDVSILAAVERYGHESPVVPVPMLHGLSKPGAICSSWAHDSHNLLVMASDEYFAARAVNLVIENQGGIATVDSSGSDFVPLSYGGIVSLEPMEVLAERVRKVRLWLKEHGYDAENEVMSFAVLALPVSPELKLSDKGMIEVAAGRIIDWRDA